MKFIVTVIISLFFIDPGSVEIYGIKNEYSSYENINYTLHNNVKDIIYMDVALYAKLDNSWQEIEIDATRKSMKSMLIYKMGGYADQHLSFDLKRLSKIYFKNNQLQILFRVSYGDDLKQMKFTTNSTVILVKN